MRLAAVLLTTLLFPATLLADTVTYTYTGNSFTLFEAFGESQIYTTSDSVSGEFTISSALAANLPHDTYLQPDSFSFSDGLQTITNLDTQRYGFNLETGSSGQITRWNIFIEVLSPVEIDAISTAYDTAPFDPLDTDTGSVQYAYSQTYGQSKNPGTWTMTSTPSAITPEPGTLLLTITGLAGVAGIIRRRMRTA